MTSIRTLAFPLICLALIAPARADDAITWTDVRPFGVEGQGWTEIKAAIRSLAGKGGSGRPHAGLGSQPPLGRTLRSVRDRRPGDPGALDAHVESDRNGPHARDRGQRTRPVCERRRRPLAWLGIGRPTRKNHHGDARQRSPRRDARVSCSTSRSTTACPRWRSALPEGAAQEGGRSARRKAQADGRLRHVDYPGGLRSRPGMVHTAILGRRFDRPFINLGFSGNGKMEPEHGRLACRTRPGRLRARLPAEHERPVGHGAVEPFVRRLRKAHPDTPIVLAEDRTYANAFLLPSQHRNDTAGRACPRAAVRPPGRRRRTGLHYLPASPR